jgi:flagellar biosynthesis regulator FlaF
MIRPQRYLNRMMIFLAAVIAALLALFEPLQSAFFANMALNGGIALVLLIGIVVVFRQVLQLRPEVAWLDAFKREAEGAPPRAVKPRLLASMARMLAENHTRASISALSMRTLLDGVATRLDEGREISRYLIALLIFLGLLGTFWGLLHTLGSIRETIAGLTVGAGDLAVMFDELKSGLEAPLSGMSTAFSSSLFGLAGSLILGFLDLQAGQAQNRFYNDLEEWMSGFTRLSAGGGGLEGDPSAPAYLSALLEQTADSLTQLQRTLARMDESRAGAGAVITALAEKTAALVDSQQEMKPVLSRLAGVLEQQRDQTSGPSEASLEHLRNLDVHLARLLEDVELSRNQMLDELRAEIRLLSRTLAGVLGGAVSGGAER